MNDLIKEIFNESNSAFERGMAAALLSFSTLLIWSAACAFIALFISMGPLTFGESFWCVNIFFLGLVLISIIVGMITAFRARKKEKEREEEDLIEQ